MPKSTSAIIGATKHRVFNAAGYLEVVSSLSLSCLCSTLLLILLQEQSDSCPHDGVQELALEQQEGD